MRVVRAPAATNCEERIGVSVSASSSDSSTAAVMVIPNWKKNRPITPLMNATGRKIATTASVAASAAKVTWREPFRAACTRFSPCSWWRTMFSSTMMASSTTMPTARLRPSSVKVLSVKPKK